MPKSPPHAGAIRLSGMRAVVADDDPFARRMIKAALQSGGIAVVAEAADGREAVALSLRHRPDVVLMDVVMPGMDGIEATQQILAERPGQVIVMLTGADQDAWLLGLRAGAVGFLSKDVDVRALPRAVEGAVRGEAAISRAMGMQLIRQLRHHPAGYAGLRPVRSRLSAREWEVLDLLCVPRTTDEIARTLVLSPETVRSHVKSILRKLQVSSRAEAVEVARHLRRTAEDAGAPEPEVARARVS
jgi:NarL family two-component system response regulator LiaR